MFGCSLKVQAGGRTHAEADDGPLISTGQAWGRFSTPWALEYKERPWEKSQRLRETWGFGMNRQ